MPEQTTTTTEPATVEAFIDEPVVERLIEMTGSLINLDIALSLDHAISAQDSVLRIVARVNQLRAAQVQIPAFMWRPQNVIEDGALSYTAHVVLDTQLLIERRLYADARVKVQAALTTLRDLTRRCS